MATKLTDPWAPPAQPTVDFGWWMDIDGVLMPGIDYHLVNGMEFPPSEFTWTVNGVTYSSQYSTNTVVSVANGQISTASYQTRGPFLTSVKYPITFDAIDTNNLGLPMVIAPPGIQIIAYRWDFGDGTTGVGPTVTVSYPYTDTPPDTTVTLTILDQLEREYTVSKPIYLALLTAIEATESRQVQGPDRT